MKRFFALLFLFSALGLHAQQARDWLLRMNKAFAEAKTCDMSFSMNYYSSKTDRSPAFSGKGQVAFGQGYYFSSFMGRTVVSNKRCSIVIDDGDHQIVYLEAMQQPKTKSTAPSPEFLLDSAVLKNADIKLISSTNSSARIRILPKEGIYESIEVQINASTYVMEELTYVYKPLETGEKAVKAVISYSSVKLNASFSESRFSEKNYITRQNGKWKGVGTRASYQVIDETNN